MFAYVIIACELAILYTVFWYIFLREPKPYTIHGDPWGTYDEAPDLTADGINTVYDDMPMHEQSNYWSMMARSARAPENTMSPRAILARKHGENSCHCQHTVASTPSVRYGWVQSQAPKRGSFARWLYFMKRKIEGLNPRLP